VLPLVLPVVDDEPDEADDEPDEAGALADVLADGDPLFLGLDKELSEAVDTGPRV
jgi:hypothetical protein